jgi:hypothetical protein
MESNAAASVGIHDHAICRVRQDGAGIGSRVPIRAVYQYLNVPPAIYKEFLDAESKGQYFNGEIRDSYEFVRVERRERGATAH